MFLFDRVTTLRMLIVDRFVRLSYKANNNKITKEQRHLELIGGSDTDTPVECNSVKFRHQQFGNVLNRQMTPFSHVDIVLQEHFFKSSIFFSSRNNIVPGEQAGV